jgi:hypothetical protein
MNPSPPSSTATLATLALAQSIAAAFAPLPQVAAIALAGSQTSGASDETSDLDIYVYTRAEIPLDVRSVVAAKRNARRVEVGNDEWGSGDEWIDGESGRGIDLMYFGTIWMETQLDQILVQHQASLGYTTAFWSTVQRSVPLYNRDGWLANMQERANEPYPEPLRRAIIAKNYPVLRTKTSAYLHQLEKAFARQDRVSLNHRLAALLASYFDILFALNRVPHPGEKRLVHYARELCPLSPEGMEAQLEALLCAQSIDWADDRLLREVSALIDGLDSLLRAEGLL